MGTHSIKFVIFLSCISPSENWEPCESQKHIDKWLTREQLLIWLYIHLLEFQGSEKVQITTLVWSY